MGWSANRRNRAPSTTVTAPVLDDRGSDLNSGASCGTARMPSCSPIHPCGSGTRTTPSPSSAVARCAPPPERPIVDALARRIVNGETFTRSVEELALHVEQKACGEITHVATPARAFEWRSLPLRRSDGSVWGRGFLFHDRSQARELAGLERLPRARLPA